MLLAQVANAADIEVAFGPVGICSHSSCEVVSLQSSVDVLTMVVKVPMVAPTAVGDTEIKITYVGPEAVPLGGEEGRSWVRSARWAVAAFEYIVSPRQTGARCRLPPLTRCLRAAPRPRGVQDAGLRTVRVTKVSCGRTTAARHDAGEAMTELRRGQALRRGGAVRGRHGAAGGRRADGGRGADSNGGKLP